MSSLSFLARLLGLAVIVIFLSASPQALAQGLSSPSSDYAPANADITVEKAPVEDNSDQMKELKKNYGSGLRYTQSCSPPHRIEYGRPLDRQDDDTSGQWEFTMGSMF